MLEIIDPDIDAIESELAGIKFDSNRRVILKDNSSFDVQACPGSGKTTLLAAKLIILSKKWKAGTNGVCVLSHTNVAKDEIVGRLKNHSTGWRFLEYPHFIGTIQEFVNRFLAIPYLKNSGLPVKSIDNDVFNAKCSSKLSYGTKTYLEKQHANILDLKITFDGTSLKTDVPAFDKVSNSDSYKDLISTKKNLMKSGYFMFREMYEFARANICQNPFLVMALKKRFGFVFIDEMQDTQKHQDELINSVFSRTDINSVVQRFGDTDQGIFDGMPDAPNETFDARSCKYSLPDSHRFTPCIAHLAKGLSYSKLPLDSSYECKNNGKHCECENYGKNVIFTFTSDDELSKIPQKYSAHVKALLTTCPDKKPVIFAVGAIGAKSEGDQFRLDKYFSSFSNDKKSTSPKFSCLYECIAYVVQQNHENITDNYKLILDCIVRYLYGTDAKIKKENSTQHFEKSSFLSSLRSNLTLLKSFNVIVGRWALQKALPIKLGWDQSVETVITVLQTILSDLPMGINQSKFWTFPSTSDIAKWSSPENCNIEGTVEDIPIQVSTIHGVKGQTHDATLVVETKFGKLFDVKKLIKNISDPHESPIEEVQAKKFMRQFYVAMSRPRQILCLAVHKNHISGYEDALVSLGWRIEPRSLKVEADNKRS